jgi:ribosomal protein S27E
MTEVHCQHCNKKLAERENGWLIVLYKGLKLQIFAAGVAMVTCPHCGKETGLRLTTDYSGVIKGVGT